MGGTWEVKKEENYKVCKHIWLLHVPKASRRVESFLSYVGAQSVAKIIVRILD